MQVAHEHDAGLGQQRQVLGLTEDAHVRGDQAFKLHVLSYLSGLRTSESITKIREIANGERDPVLREQALDYALGR